MSEYPIVGDAENGYSTAQQCSRCVGRGYHHGFGEFGHDPDWCTLCGGAQVEWHDLLTPPET